METIEATFRIVTPMFLGGADPEQASDGIRPPSVKGALRFWWRALNWGRFRGESGADDSSALRALRALHAEEGRLFGLAADPSGGGGQGCFSMRVANQSAIGSIPIASVGHKYMLGQGLVRPNGTYLRQAICEGSFTVKLVFSRSRADDRLQITKALMALGTLGGLGSRSRRGLGSIALESISGLAFAVPIPSTYSQYPRLLEWLGLPVICTLPVFSAFSTFTRVDVSSVGTDAWALLDNAGVEMMRFRGWGYNDGNGVHRVAGAISEKNFRPDHDFILLAVQGVPPTTMPQRAIFGLPHNYFFKSEFRKLMDEKTLELQAQPNPQSPEQINREAKQWASARAKAEIAPANKGQTRRASPILVHAHRFPDQSAAIVQTFMPAVFLPNSNRVKISARRLPGEEALVAKQENWESILQYLNRFNVRQMLIGKESLL